MATAGGIRTSKRKPSSGAPPVAPATDRAPVPPAPDAPFEWTAHPAREKPWLAIVVVLAIVVLVAVVIGLDGGLAWPLFGAVVIVFSLHRFFFASYYQFDADGLAARTLSGKRRLRWDDIRRVDVGTSAAWLSPLAERGWREGRRGVLLLFGGQREAVLRELRARLPASAFSSPQRT